MQCALHPQNQRQREIVEVVIDRRSEPGDDKVVRRHVQQKALQEGHVVQMILSGWSIENQLTVGKSSASPEERRDQQSRGTAGNCRLIALRVPLRPFLSLA